LTHRALAEHFTGDDEVRSALQHILPGLAQQVDAAVHAGVDPLAVAMAGIADDFEIVQALVDDFDRYVEFLGDTDSFGFTA